MHVPCFQVTVDGNPARPRRNKAIRTTTLVLALETCYAILRCRRTRYRGCFQNFHHSNQGIVNLKKLLLLLDANGDTPPGLPRKPFDACQMPEQKTGPQQFDNMEIKTYKLAYFYSFPGESRIWNH
jgi:hypothetical protein